jgi:two-component system cell cycle sensor histidine kinase/response regulator CckA
VDESSRAEQLGSGSVARESELGTLLDRSPIAVLVLDADDLRILDANASARRELELPTEVTGLDFSEVVANLPVGHAQALLRRLRDGLVDHLVMETVKRSPGGDSTPIEIRLSYSAEPTPRYLALILDMSGRSKPDDLAIRRERLRDALAEILRAITRIDDRDELYRDACRIAVERGGFRMGWIGLVDEETGEVRPVASAGHVEGYLDVLHLTLRDGTDVPGMTVTAIRTGQPVAVADPRTDPMFTTLKPEVMKRGYESAVALPLVVEGRAIGALTVYATVVNAFGAIEVELLKHLAEDISFKLEVIGREETRRAAESERDRLAAVVEQAGESVLITDGDGRIVYTNAAFTNITGYELNEVMGRRPDFLRGESQSPESAVAIREAILEGKSWTGHSRDRRKGGTELDMDLVISPRRDDAGQVVGTIVIGRDMSRERSLEAQLVQSQKLEAIGRLAGGVAHDFNNLLTAISGYAEILKADLGADDPRATDVSEIQRAAARATQLTGQLLAFSRRQILSPRPLDPESVVAGIAPMLRRLIGEDVLVVTRVRSGLGSVMADPSQLDQVLVNLALNARDAMPIGGRLDIEADEVDLDDGFVADHVGSHAGPHVVFRVRDTGTGMTREVLDHAFEPFFTTKGPGKGTGLGLSTVLGIMAQSNGYVDVDSEPEHGTTFHLYLPRASTREVVADPGREAMPAVRGAGTVLVVEDEGAVRALVCRILEKGGYSVLAAGSGEQALQLEAAHPGQIDLLFTDVILPGISGRTLAREMSTRRPGMPVLYASGYNEEIVASRGVLEAGISYLAKPYTTDELLGRLRELVRPPSDASDPEVHRR